MVLRAGQRRQAEEFQDVDRQLALDDLDVAPDRFRVVVGEAEDVAGDGEDTRLFAGQQKRPVIGDLVLPFLARLQRLGVDVFQADEDVVDAGAPRLVDEVRHAVALRVHLYGELDLVQALLLAQPDKSVEDRFPILVAGEIVVGDEEPINAFRDIAPDDRGDVLRRARAGLAALHVDDGAE